MLRSCNLAQRTLIATYVQNHKKPVVDLPPKTPPKYVFEITYKKTANPGVDLGFPDHIHLNKWNQQSFMRLENFRYKYSGQWWEGSTLMKLFMFFGPILTGISFYYSSVQAEQYRKGHPWNLPILQIHSNKGLIGPEI